MEMMAAAVPRSSRPFFSRRFLLPDAPDAGQHRVRDFCSGDRKRIGGSGPQAADTPREKCCRFDGDASGRRIYAYANNDPLNLIDALGLDSYSFYAATKSVFLGPVNSGFSHTSVIIVDVGDMGTTYTDLAAGPSNSFGKVGTLFGLSTLTPAYTGDRLADDLSGQLSSNQLTPIQVPPGQTPEDFAANLTAAADTYQGGDEYDAMGGGGFLGYNSNSFAAGVIGAAGGIPPSLSATLPGYFTPLPMAKQNCQ
jgi:hypothetical protein